MPRQQSTEAGALLAVQSTSRGQGIGYNVGATYNDDEHSDSTFPSNNNCCADENQDGHGNCSQSERKLDILSARHDDHELNREPKEEEEIELEQCDINLKRTKKEPVSLEFPFVLFLCCN